MTGNWRHLRAQFALEGIDWRSWTAADRAAVTYLLFKRNLHDEPAALRELYELVEDTDALAALGQQLMGQDRTIVTDR